MGRGTKIEKKVRIEVYQKYNGRCAYCGNQIEYKDMQVDHVRPKSDGGINKIENYNPSCIRCNTFKSSYSLEKFRSILLTLHDAILKLRISKVALNFGILTIQAWDGLFHFEKVELSLQKEKERADKAEARVRELELLLEYLQVDK